MNTKTNNLIIRREIAVRITGMKRELETISYTRWKLLAITDALESQISLLRRDIAGEMASAPPVRVKPSKR